MVSIEQSNVNELKGKHHQLGKDDKIVISITKLVDGFYNSYSLFVNKFFTFILQKVLLTHLHLQASFYRPI